VITWQYPTHVNYATAHNLSNTEQNLYLVTIWCCVLTSWNHSHQVIIFCVLCSTLQMLNYCITCILILILFCVERPALYWLPKHW